MRDDLVTLEAEIFSILAAEAPEKVQTFSKLICIMDYEFEHIPSEEAYQAGVKAREQNITYEKGYCLLLAQLTQRPEVLQRYEDRQALFNEISALPMVKHKITAFIERLREHNKSSRLERSYAQGYQEPYGIGQDILKELDRILETIYDEIENEAINGLGAKYYRRFAKRAIELEKCISLQLNEMELHVFNLFNDTTNKRMYLSERYFFVRGIRLAVAQIKSPTPNWLDSDPIDFESLFDYASMDQLCNEKITAVSREDMDRIQTKLKNDIWDEFEQNKYDMSCNLRCALLLSGYLLAIRFMQQTCVGFQENVHFTNKLIAALSDYLQEYSE